MVCNKVASIKSHIMSFPPEEPVINWKELSGLTMADVIVSEDVSLCNLGAVNVETTWPVKTEWILTEEPARAKK